MSKKLFIVLFLLLVGIVFLSSKVLAAQQMCIDCETASQAKGPDNTHSGRGGGVVQSHTRSTIVTGPTNQMTCPEFLEFLKTTLEAAGWTVTPVDNRPDGRSWICIDKAIGAGIGWSDGGLRGASCEPKIIPQPILPKFPKVQPGNQPQGGDIIITTVEKDTVKKTTTIPTNPGEPPDSINKKIRKALEKRGIIYSEGIAGYPIHPTFDDSLVYLPSFIILADSLGRRLEGLIYTVTDSGISVSGVTSELIEEEIPTLTEWGLIIFGVVLLGFISYVFLRRRKAVVSYQ